MIPPDNLELAKKILRRQKVKETLIAHLTFTGHLRDRVRRTRVTMIIAKLLNKNHDNVELIHYVEATMRGLGASVVNRHNVIYFRGVRANDEEDGKPIS
jgi:hypothetical protein